MSLFFSFIDYLLTTT